MKLPLASCVLLVPALLSSCSTARPTPGALGFDAAGLDGWRIESTHGAAPHATWEVRADAGAISAPNVLALTGAQPDSDDRFNLCWSRAHEFRDGRIAVHVRADHGAIDQGGGPIWRVRDAQNYYLCRVNPLESNLRVYVVRDGIRRQLATARVGTAAGEWHRIEVEHVGTQIRCRLDGRPLLAADDETLTEAGGVGLWTKADARTSFDDLQVLAATR